MLLRYGIAVIVACIITAGGFGLAQHLRSSFIAELRQHLRTMKAEGKLPQELESVDIDNFTPEGWEVRLTEGQERRLKTADWLRYGWHIWVPVVFVASIAVAYFTTRRGPQ